MAMPNSAGTSWTLCVFRAVEHNPTNCVYINIRNASRFLMCETCRVIYRVELISNRREMDRLFPPLTVSSESENDDITDGPPLIDLADEDTSVGSCPYDQDINIDTSDSDEHAGEHNSDVDDFDYDQVYGPISSRFLANPFFGISGEEETCDAATQTEAEEDSFDAATQTETEDDDTQVDEAETVEVDTPVDD